ncbi:MAG: PorV/PorQ family protein [FCB group bacterium]|nr:PorV/PorQ family protein [FCB group bacterium]
MINRRLNPLVLYLLLSVIILPKISTAQLIRHVSKVGTTAASFLEVGVGARALAMGEAFVAVANDVTALYWNPAGIAAFKGRPAAQFFHSPWLADITFDYAAALVPLGVNGTFGVSITGVTMNDMDVRTIVYPEGTGEKFGANNLTLGASYGRRLTDRFSFGFNVKHVQEQIWHMSASTMAVDIGVLFITKKRGIRIGMSVSNFGKKMRLEGRDTKINVDIDEEKAGNNDRIDAHLDTWRWPLPLLFRFGLSSNIIDTKYQRLTVAADAVHPNNNLEYINIGLEYVMNDMIALRMGRSALLLDDAEQGFSYGAGLKYEIMRNVKLNLDYVIRSLGVFDYISGYSISLTF